jgi:hypothetical protein
MNRHLLGRITLVVAPLGLAAGPAAAEDWLTDCGRH